MKIVLVSSPGLRKLEVYQSIGVRAPPLGLAYIGAVLENEGYKVKIIDAPTLDLTTEETFHAIIEEKPDVIGISSVTSTVKGAYTIARMIKEFDPDIPVIMGGPHVSFMYKEALVNGADYVVIGEGELTTLELVKHLEQSNEEPKHVRGIAFLSKDGHVIKTPPRPFIRNLDQLPYPARHLLPMDKYTLFDKPIKIIHIMASRGCPYGCIYCATSYFWGRFYRIRTVEKVVDEIEENMDKYKTNIIVFSDDELTLIKKWVNKLSEEIMRRKLDIGFTCGSRVNTIDPQTLKNLSIAGCKTIYYGIESYKDEDLRKIRKMIKISQAIKAVQWTKKFGIESVGSFILGFPWQTIEDMKNTVKFSEKLGVDYAQFTVATPYPGTPLYELAKKEGLIEITDWDYYTTIYPVMRGYYFERKELTKILGWAYRHFYLRPKFILSQLKKGRLRTILSIASRAIKGMVKGANAKDESKKPTYIKEAEKEIVA